MELWEALAVALFFAVMSSITQPNYEPIDHRQQFSDSMLTWITCSLESLCKRHHQSVPAKTGCVLSLSLVPNSYPYLVDVWPSFQQQRFFLPNHALPFYKIMGVRKTLVIIISVLFGTKPQHFNNLSSHINHFVFGSVANCIVSSSNNSNNLLRVINI